MGVTKEFIEHYFKEHCGQKVRVQIRKELHFGSTKTDMRIRLGREGTRNVPILLSISQRFLNSANISDVKACILHEVGHIKTQARTVSRMEYLAQKWAIDHALSIGAKRVVKELINGLHDWSNPVRKFWTGPTRRYAIAYRIAIREGVCNAHWVKNGDSYKLVKIRKRKSK